MSTTENKFEFDDGIISKNLSDELNILFGKIEIDKDKSMETIIIECIVSILGLFYLTNYKLNFDQVGNIIESIHTTMIVNYATSVVDLVNTPIEDKIIMLKKIKESNNSAYDFFSSRIDSLILKLEIDLKRIN